MMKSDFVLGWGEKGCFCGVYLINDLNGDFRIAGL